MEQETFVCSRCNLEHEIDFRVSDSWELVIDEEILEGSKYITTRNVFVQICGNCEAYQEYDTCGIDPIPCNNCDDDLPF